MSAEFDGLRHLRISLLCDDELAQLTSQSSDFEPYYEVRPWRCVNSSGCHSMLERYWSKKVIGIDGHDCQVCERMVGARTLRVSLTDLNPAGLGSHLTQLLSSHVRSSSCVRIG